MKAGIRILYSVSVAGRFCKKARIGSCVAGGFYEWLVDCVLQ